MYKLKDDDMNWSSLCQTEPPCSKMDQKKKQESCKELLQIAPVEDRDLDF